LLLEEEEDEYYKVLIKYICPLSQTKSDTEALMAEALRLKIKGKSS